MNLITNRLVLRDFRPRDIDDYVRMTGQPEYQPFYNENDCSPEFSTLLVNRFIDQSREQPRTKFQLAIELKSSQSFIGTVGLRMESDSRASFGFGLDIAYQGQGFASEAAVNLIEWGFSNLNLKEIYAETLLENEHAVRLLTRLGFEKTAIQNNNLHFKNRTWSQLTMTLRHSR